MPWSIPANGFAIARGGVLTEKPCTVMPIKSPSTLKASGIEYAKNPGCRKPFQSSLAEKARIRYTEIGRTRSTANVSAKIMNSLRLALTVGFLSLISPILAGTGLELQPAPSPSDENKNSTKLFAYETVYTGNSDFKHYRGAFGDCDSLYNDVSFAHRIHITAHCYFRAGVEYERFDFGGTDNGLPDHLQTIHALLAYEYIFHDHAGAGVEIDPGPYFQNHVTGDSIDVPWKVWVTFPLKKYKIFAVIGAVGSIYSNPIVAPGRGLIWLFSDH